ncbi:MAG: CBS domain-containing protein [Anaerolineae bacterium]|nr:CBS domain-containing protein [Anaerolineae bacterium]
MHLVVTHENADFDAVASLLGAVKLYPTARALLPNRLNRNVRDFLTLYGDEFPFLWPHELPQGHVTRLTVVDTQHIPPLRGLDAQTVCRVIDHHARAPHLSEGVIATLQDTGATVTLLVEEIKAQHIPLSPREATLLLLGIYEDTGSLLYSSTTPRDVYAAAWLMEQGAAMEVVRQFLKYPLSEEQQTLYRRLIDAMQTYSISGHVIMVATATAERYIEEISTLAHKLRDLFEPDALFLLVAMEDHIQLVARSTTDAIDVGFIAGMFGGGGHARAAAALVRGVNVEEVHAQLLDLLHRSVRPSVTVGDIMSRGVHTLSPHDTVARAAEMMARYGHEGFPVVEGGRVVGVLTRREIDKALHHKLGNSAISRIMRKGEIYVTPHDSVEKLQEVMTREGIGQVPVVNGDQVIGIVTRTDLIKLWSAAPSASRAAQMVRRMEEVMPAALLQLLREAGRIAAEQGDTLYIVGGFVRDLLHRTNSQNHVPYPDIDLVVEGDAIRLARRLAQQYGGQVRSHQRFGTAKWLLPPALQLSKAHGQSMPSAETHVDVATQGLPPALDFVTARMEFYEHPTALPEVERSSIKQDLHRRDFTINTLAICLAPDRFGELLDFYGGEHDLQRGLIRVLHSLSFVEDPTRILRAVRLEQRLGFQIEARTLELLQGAIDLLDRVSGERILHELLLILREAEPERALSRLDALGVLRQVHPALRADAWAVQRMAALRQAREGTPWERVKPAEGHYLSILTFRMDQAALEQLITRLHVPGQLADTLRQVELLRRTRLPLLEEPQRPSRLYALLAPFDTHSLLIAWLGSEDAIVRAQLAQFESELRGVQPIIDGHYLRRVFKLRPGPIYRQIIDALRGARLDGEVVTLEDEHAWVEHWLSERADGEVSTKLDSR